MPQPTDRRRRPRIVPLVEFLNTEAGGGVLLLAATVVALVWANSAWADAYRDLWHGHLDVGPAGWGLHLTLHHWVNDGLMTVFFFLIGLEIKRELVVGELRDPRTALLPAVAALGGMAVPAILYLGIAGGGHATAGWGIPMATDIAFAVGVLALLGSRVPPALKLFLLTLAIVDDLGAIAVIAIFYSDGVQPGWLMAAIAVLGMMRVMAVAGVSRSIAYLPIGVLAWYATLRAGLHPTIAGVAVGLLTPAAPIDGRQVIEELEHRLHPWSSYAIVPLFALANAGVDLRHGLGDALTSRIAIAVAVGLVVGKSAGIFLSSVGAIATGGTRLPAGVTRSHLFGAGALGGIGFTVALFIASLAFEDGELETQAKIGILGGSLVSAIVGAAVLATVTTRRGTPVEQPGVP